MVCLFRQALNTIRVVSDDPAVHRRMLDHIAKEIPSMSLDQSPADLSKCVYVAVADLTGVTDPYKAQKRETNRVAMELRPRLIDTINRSSDPLRTALLVAAGGNIIDLGIGHQFDIEADLFKILKQGFEIDAFEEFRRELGPRRKLLYLGDNAGEIVFDALLVEHILKTGTKVTFAVKSGPIINDATMEDAEETGLTKLVKVIETGSDHIGVNWRHVSQEFREAFEGADLIISKGHGNFETCDERPENIYFLLKTKCEVVAAALGLPPGSTVFKHKPGR
jgi:damage-control phosphatase, subfamily I